MISDSRAGDAKLVLPQAMQADEAADYADAFDDIEAYSLMDEKSGDVLAVFGYQLINEDEAACFAIVSQHIGMKLREMIVFAQRLIEKKMDELHLQSVVMTVRHGFEAGDKLARRLGFRAVAWLPDFYLGYDYQLFERRA